MIGSSSAITMRSAFSLTGLLNLSLSGINEASRAAGSRCEQGFPGPDEARGDRRGAAPVAIQPKIVLSKEPARKSALADLGDAKRDCVRPQGDRFRDLCHERANRRGDQDRE